MFSTLLSLLDYINSSTNWQLLVIMEILFFKWKSEVLFSYKHYNVGLLICPSWSLTEKKKKEQTKLCLTHVFTDSHLRSFSVGKDVQTVRESCYLMGSGTFTFVFIQTLGICLMQSHGGQPRREDFPPEVTQLSPVRIPLGFPAKNIVES